MNSEQMNVNPPRKIQIAAIITLSFLSLFLLVKTLNAFGLFEGTSSEASANTISVSGEGDVSAAPDTATFNYSIIENANTVADAESQATTKNNATIAFLKQSGVDEKDIQTSDFDVSPRYNTPACANGICTPSTGLPVGYTVTVTTTVKVRDLSKAGALLSGVGTQGASNISSLSFTIDNDDALKSQARAKAITDARSKAEELAKDLGVRLGKVTSYSEDQGPTPIYYSSKSDMAVSAVAPAAATPTIETGQNKITVNVNVTYSIK